MTPFRRLCLFELQMFLTRPLTWLVLGGLFVAMIVGAATGAERVRAQERTIERLLAQEDRSRQAARDAAKRYSIPSSLKVENHRDPTDAFGYMNYFLVAHAYKLPAPLAALAVGQSDLLPFYERVDFTAVLSSSAYEAENPRTLAVGSFDLAFVLVYLLPLAVIALMAHRLSSEQDSGVLRLIASSPTPPWQVAVAKLGVPALAIAALAVVLTFGALWVSGAFRSAPGWPAAMVALAISGYTLLWCAAAAVVVTLWKGMVQSVVTLASAWLVVTLIVPSAAALIVGQLAPAPSRAAYVDASREAMDAFYSNEQSVYARYIAARSNLPGASSELASNSAVKRFARDEAYKEPLREWEARFRDHERRVDSLSAWLQLLSPALVLDGILQRAAGTDRETYRRFAQRSARHTEQLRQFFEPVVLANSVRGEKTSCAECAGHLNFTDYDRVPVYVPEEAAVRAGALTGTGVSFIWAVMAALALRARRQLREWPA